MNDVEAYVLECIDKDDLSWFPGNDTEANELETKIDLLAAEQILIERRIMEAIESKEDSKLFSGNYDPNPIYGNVRATAMINNYSPNLAVSALSKFLTK